MYHYNDTYMNKIKMIRLEEAIQEIKLEIAAIEEMRPGSLSKQMRRSKGKYGAYWHLSYTLQGKGHTKYIREQHVSQVKREVGAFKRFKRLIERLITLSIRRSELKMEIQEQGASN